MTDQHGSSTGANFVLCGVPWTCTVDCAADLDGNGMADVDDFFLFLDLYEAGDDRADLDGNGRIDVDDFFSFLELFVSPDCT